jgi:hypothetical protein
VKFARVLPPTLNISVNTTNWNSAGEFISEFLLPKLGGRYRITNNIGSLVAAVNTTVLTNNEVTVQQNKID